MEKTIGVRLPDWMLEKLDAAAERRLVTRSDLVRFAVNKFLEEEPPKRGRAATSRAAKGDRRPRRNAQGRS